MLKKSLLLSTLLLLITIYGCNKESSVVLSPPEITFPNGDTGTAERGTILNVNVKLTAEAGIASLTINGASVSNINIGDTEQELSVGLSSESTDMLGDMTFEFELIDQGGESSKETYTLTLNPAGVVQSDTVTIYDNVEFISEEVQLVSTVTQIENGTFVFESDQDLSLEVGDVIVGAQNGGYLRRVQSIGTNGDQTSVETEQGTITELFRNTNMTLDLNQLITNTNGRSNTETTFREDFNNIKLLEEGLSSMTVNGYVELDANYKLNLNIQNGSIQSIDFSSAGTTLDVNILSTIHVEDRVSVANSEYEIITVSKNFASVSPPVFGSVNFTLKAKVSSDIKASLTSQSTTREKAEINFDALYANGSWTGTLSSRAIISENNTDIGGVVDIANELRFIAEVDIELYGVGGPYFNPEAYGTLNLGAATPSGDWDAYSDVGYEGVFGVEAEIFGLDLRYEEQIPKEEIRAWEAPHSLQIVNGNNQEVPIGNPSNPLRVTVLDNLGNPLAGVPVYFEVNEGDGVLDASKVYSNSSGYADAIFTAGEQLGSSTINVYVRNRDVTDIDMKSFTIETIEGGGCDGIATISWGGYDYKIVKIGSDCWFAENLRIDIGTNIQNDIAWMDATGPAWSHWLNDPSYEALYGKLYNRAAILSNICPSGWHVPSAEEFQTKLISQFNRLQLKSTTNWRDENGNNESGFNAYPAGYRMPQDANQWYFATTQAWFWTTTEDETSWYILYMPHTSNPRITKLMKVNYNGSNSIQYNRGASCRCIRD